MPRKPVDVVSEQRALLDRVHEVIAEHFHDPDFGVDRLSDFLGLAKTRLHRQLIQAGSLPPASLIRQQRMEAARTYIQQDFGNVSQIMYAVGFNSLSSFIAAFKKEFGMTPNTMISKWVNFRSVY